MPHELLGRDVTTYIPCPAVAEVIGNTVRLNVDMETASGEGWGRRPAWIGQQRSLG